MKKKVLFLGATGRIGPSLIEEIASEYNKDYEIILGYHRTKSKNHKSVKVDLSNLSQLKKAFKGMHTIVNLAAESNPAAPFDKIVQPNLIGAYNVFEAARASKVKRVVFASSVHAVRGYELGNKVKDTQAPKPLNFYGASKVFGEALCYVFSNKYNLSCLAIRIGAYVSNDQKKKVCLTRNNFDYVISQRDMAQLIHKCITAKPSLKYGILAGSSNNKRQYLDLSSARKLVGYNPKDSAEKMCAGVK